MKPDDDPLWYDRVESDENFNGFDIIPIASLVVGGFLYMCIVLVLRTLKVGADSAFRDAATEGTVYLRRPRSFANRRNYYH